MLQETQCLAYWLLQEYEYLKTWQKKMNPLWILRIIDQNEKIE